jgi:hypothetical protein
MTVGGHIHKPVIPWSVRADYIAEYFHHGIDAPRQCQWNRVQDAKNVQSTPHDDIPMWLPTFGRQLLHLVHDGMPTKIL